MTLKKNQIAGLLMTLGIGCLTAAPAFAENGSVPKDCLIFAKCEESINVREGPSVESKVVGVLNNYDYAEIFNHEDGWYEILSGSVYGFVDDRYFATGAEAEQIAQEVAYNVAVVYPDELNIHEKPEDDSEVIAVATKDEEIEVVAYEGDWMKVALGGDVYGYVSAYYVGTRSYYPSADFVSEDETEEETEKEEKKEEEKHEEPKEEQEQKSDASEMTEAVLVESEDYTYTEQTAAASYTDTSADYSYTQDSTDYSYTQDSASYSTDYNYTEQAAAVDYSWSDTTSTDTTSTDTTSTDTTSSDTATVSLDDSSSWSDTSSTTTSSGSGAGQAIVDEAMQYLGNPYVWGGTSLTTGADCSGFTQSILADNGISIARTAADQSAGGTSVNISDVEAGDLLFYSDGSGISHVAIYAGNGQVVHSADESTGVIVSNYDYQTPVAAVRYWE